jgi:hypothetical protein
MRSRYVWFRLRSQGDVSQRFLAGHPLDRRKGKLEQVLTAGGWGCASLSTWTATGTEQFIHLGFEEGIRPVCIFLLGLHQFRRTT